MDDPFDLPPDVLRRVPLFAELQKVLGWTGGPINWDLARQVAVSIAAGEGSTARIEGSDHEAAEQDIRLAELWLTETTGLIVPGAPTRVLAATPADWAERAPAIFGELMEPIAGKASRALSEQLGSAAGPEPQAMIAQALGQVAPMFMGIQAGTVLGSLARDVTGSHDIALPLAGDEIALVLERVDAVATEYQLDRRAVRMWSALRAAAHHLTIESFPLVRTQFFALFHNYVASLDIDLAAGMERLQSLDFTDPARLRDALGEESLFSPTSSPEAEAAAARIGRFLSVVEAYIDAAVVTAGARTGDGSRVAEAFRRRAAEGGQGMRQLQAFLGLSEMPAGRHAASFVRAVLGHGGWDMLARALDEPDAFPNEGELIDPEVWIRRMS